MALQAPWSAEGEAAACLLSPVSPGLIDSLAWAGFPAMAVFLRVPSAALGSPHSFHGCGA